MYGLILDLADKLEQGKITKDDITTRFKDSVQSELIYRYFKRAKINNSFTRHWERRCKKAA